MEDTEVAGIIFAKAVRFITGSLRFFIHSVTSTWTRQVAAEQKLTLRFVPIPKFFPSGPFRSILRAYSIAPLLFILLYLRTPPGDSKGL